MKKKESLINILIISYCTFIFFNGLYTKLLFPIGLISIKKILPELILIILLLLMGIECWQRKLFKINIYFIGLIFYIIMFSFQLLHVEDGSIIYAIRDNILPFILLYVFNSYIQKKTCNADLTKWMGIFIKIFVISGLALGLVQFIMGASWTAEFYTGYDFYERDPQTGVKIWHIGKYLRVPSVTGDSVIFGICNLFAFFFLDLFNDKRIYKLSAWVNILLSTSRTMMIIHAIYFILTRYKVVIVLVKKRSNKYHIKLFKDNTIESLNKEALRDFVLQYKKIVLILILILITIFLIGCIMIFNRFPSLNSLYERINGVWLNIFNNLSFSQFIIGKGVFEVGSGMKASLAVNSTYQYIFSFVDNTYIYILLCYGLFGLTLFILMNVQLIKETIRFNNYYFLMFIIASLIGAFTLNYMQGRSFIFLFYIFILFINPMVKGGIESE